MSARDVGNLFAGYVAGAYGADKETALRVMGAFNMCNNKLYRIDCMIESYKINANIPYYGEDPNSHSMQRIGYDYGFNDRTVYQKFNTDYLCRQSLDIKNKMILEWY
jgi:hypothetical protein